MSDQGQYQTYTPAGSLDGTEIGLFYLDPFARQDKRGGAWMDEAITRRKVLELVTTPVAFLTCNFSAPVGDKPALFTHDEVLTMFHEFGHALHGMLSNVVYPRISGTSAARQASSPWVNVVSIPLPE